MVSCLKLCLTQTIVYFHRCFVSRPNLTVAILLVTLLLNFAALLVLRLCNAELPLHPNEFMTTFGSCHDSRERKCIEYHLPLTVRGGVYGV